MIVWCDEKKLRTLGMREGDNTWEGGHVPKTLTLPSSPVELV